MRKPDTVRFRRSPFLLCYWRGGQMVFENFVAGVRIGAAPLTCEILSFFDRWRALEEFCSHFAQYGRASLRKTLGLLVKCSLLQRSDGDPDAAERALAGWEPWNPAAGFFHFSSKNVHYDSDLAAFERLLRQRARTTPMPEPVKRYPDARQILLPLPNTEGEFPQVLLSRRTWRRFSRRPVELAAVSTLLGLTCAVQHWVDLPGLGRLVLKSFPSGGAHHPLEAYLLALRVKGLSRGLYHYAADSHRLELLRRGGTARQLVSYLPTQGWYGSAAALLLITAVFSRTQWKYRFPRAYRAVLTEAGHLCQNFCLVATWLGLAPFCSLALADSRVEKDLGIDGATESVLYAAGVGTRPEGADSAPWPNSRQPSRTTAHLWSALVP